MTTASCLQQSGCHAGSQQDFELLFGHRFIEVLPHALAAVDNSQSIRILDGLVQKEFREYADSMRTSIPMNIMKECLFIPASLLNRFSTTRYELTKNYWLNIFHL